MLSLGQRDTLHKLNMKTPGGCRIIADVLPKQNIFLDYRQLKYFLSKGGILTKLHNVVQYRQSKYGKKFIEYNAKLFNDSKIIKFKHWSDVS